MRDLANIASALALLFAVASTPATVSAQQGSPSDETTDESAGEADASDEETAPDDSETTTDDDDDAEESPQSDDQATTEETSESDSTETTSETSSQDEEKSRDEPPSGRTDSSEDGGSAEPSPESDPETPDTVLSQGRFEFGVSLAFLWSLDSSVPDSGGRAATSSLFADSGAFVGYMLTDIIQLRFQGGWTHVTFANESQTIQRTNAASMVFQGLFHWKVGEIIALYGGPGLGAYFGQTVRQINGLKAENPTNGFVGQAFAGTLIELSDVVAVRSGVKLDFLAGVETPATNRPSLQRRDTLNVKALGFIELSGKL